MTAVFPSVLKIVKVVPVFKPLSVEHIFICLWYFLLKCETHMFVSFSTTMWNTYRYVFEYVTLLILFFNSIVVNLTSKYVKKLHE